MIYDIGSAVRIKSTVNVATNTTVTLLELIGPNGSTILSNQAMAFDQTDPLEATLTWQSEIGVHLPGRYTYKTKAVNGNYYDTAKGYFFLEEE